MAELPDDWRRRWPPMTYWVKWTVAVVLTYAVLSAARSVLNILVLVVIAAVLAVGLDRAVRRLERLKVKRGWAVAVIFLSAILFIALFATLVVPPLVSEVRQLASDIPGYVERLKTQGGWLGDLARKYDLSEKLKTLTERLPSVASASFSTILGLTKGITAQIFNLLTIYFLLSMPRMRTTSMALFSPDRREQGGRILSEALSKIGGFVSGNILTSLIAGGAVLVALAVLGIPFSVALAMWVAIADLIPAVGATLGAIPAVIVALFSSTADGLATLAFFVVYQQLENYLIVPRIMKEAVDLSPAAVIVSTLIGGSLAGFAGALLALPLAAALKVVINDVWLRQRLEATASEEV
ncbi:MAG: AI-2E family transporter [Actinobacteria bacterium]|nr:AI-2E family transporter [Actinomycetota bacterium]